MTLGREDMLRELELLPMWRQQRPAALQTAPAVTQETAQTQAVEAQVVETQTVPATLDRPVTPSLPTPASEVVAPSAAPEPAPLVSTPWLLYCPGLGDGAGQADVQSQVLLANIVRALGVPAEQLTLWQSPLQQSPLRQSQANVQFAVLFGLEAANAFLQTQHTALAQVRDCVMLADEMHYVITHHPHALLADPRLKKEVWSDLCRLLAKK